MATNHVDHDPADEPITPTAAKPSDDFVTTTAEQEDDDGATQGYTPGGGAGPRLSLSTPKRKVKTLDPKKVAYIAVAIAVLVGFALLQAFSPRKPKGPNDSDQQVTTTNPPKAEGLNALPSDYATLAQQEAQKQKSVPKLGAPMPGDVGAAQVAQQRAAGMQYGQKSQEVSEIERLQQAQELAKYKRAASAVDARPSFQSQLGGGAGSTGVGLSQGGMQPAAYPQIPGPPGPDKSGRDTDNRQDDKMDFASHVGKQADNPYLTASLIRPRDLNVIQASTQIPALFLTGVNSDLPGMLTAQVSQDVYDTPTGAHVLIPQGTRLIGEYDSRVTYGQERVLLVWTRLIFPNGSSIQLEGMPGVDMSGYAGVKDKVDNHWGKIIGAVLLSSSLSVAVAESQGNSVSAFNQSTSQVAAQGAAQGINQAGEKIVQRALNVQPTLMIRPGQRVAVMVNKDIELPPYGG
jgi:type IV secretion system protein VirB10